MNFEPLLGAPPAVQLHVATVVPAFVLGTWLLFFSTKGAWLHRRVGYAYLTLMAVTSIAALFIHEVNPGGPFGLSFIHIFVAVTLFGIVGALRGAWTHNIPLHRGSMIGTYVGGLLIAGGFAFAPGRIHLRQGYGGPNRPRLARRSFMPRRVMNELVFGQAG